MCNTLARIGPTKLKSMINDDKNPVNEYTNDIKIEPAKMLPNKRIDNEISGDTALKIFVGGKINSLMYFSPPLVLKALYCINVTVTIPNDKVIDKFDVVHQIQSNH